jgi:DNA polymerase (family 10)
MGIPLSISTDSHSTIELQLSEYGVSVARRAWAGPENVLTAWAPERLVGWLKQRK